MNPDPLRQQLNQRYLAEKIRDGADVKEIADGFGDPVAEMQSIVGASPPKSVARQPSTQAPAWGIFLLLGAMIIVLLFLFVL